MYIYLFKNEYINNMQNIFCYSWIYEHIKIINIYKTTKLVKINKINNLE